MHVIEFSAELWNAGILSLYQSNSNTDAFPAILKILGTAQETFAAELVFSVAIGGRFDSSNCIKVTQTGQPKWLKRISTEEVFLGIFRNSKFFQKSSGTCMKRFFQKRVISRQTFCYLYEMTSLKTSFWQNCNLGISEHSREIFDWSLFLLTLEILESSQ